jgi:ribosomal protein S18 acetylase RimI-like enzyme
VGGVGAAKSYLFDAADLVEFAVEWIEGAFADVEPYVPDISTRRADPKDHRELVELLGAYEAESMSSAKSETRRSTRVDDFLEEKDHAVFVAETSDRLVGMLVVSQTAPDRGELQLAFVEPGFREHGVLRELEADASEYLRDLGCHLISLRVDVQNEAAREAWHNLGYASTMEHMERPL